MKSRHNIIIYSKAIFLGLFIFIFTNSMMVMVHWVTDYSVSEELSKTRFEQAFKTGAIIESVQLHKNLKHGDPRNQIGIDQYSECANGLMIINEIDRGSFKNAVVPAFQTQNNAGINCRDLNQLAQEKADVSQMKTRTKARLWHGAKPFTMALLPKFEYYQITNLIRQLSQIGLSLLLAYTFVRSKHAGMALLPFVVIAVMGSGLNVYGGIANALPYTTAIFLALFIAWSQSKVSWLNSVYCSIIAGSLMAFVYILDGSLILVLSLLLFLLYFTASEPSRVKRWKTTLILCSVFVLSFFMSFIFKQLISALVLSPEQVWHDFIAYLNLRMDTAQGGKIRSHWKAFGDQVELYDLATSWNMFLRNIIVIGGYIAWMGAIVLAMIVKLRFKTWASISDLLVFGLIAFVVFFRYAAMIGHSYIHWFIVGQYVFVFFAFGMSALVWMILLYQRNKVIAADD